jgi:ABC-type multidrug transport system fused ATPase/permease subunit
MFIGHKSKIWKSSFHWFKVSENLYCNRISLLTKKISRFAIAGMILCFIVMKFIPAFAADPFQAKFFRGIYQASYSQVAIFFRSSHFILQFIIPILIVMWYYYKKVIYLILSLISILLLSLCLTRGPAFYGLLVGIGIIVATKEKKYFKYYIISLFLIYSVGSASYYIIGIFSGKESFFIGETNSGFIEIVSRGAPDIFDHLTFLTAFSKHPEYTYGRTFLGGLIPNHYFWNPSVWSLYIINGNSDVNDVASGGLRLSFPIWGYVSFSWYGVVLLSFIVGFLTGKVIKKIQFLLQNTNNIIIKTIIILLYIKVYSCFISFYLMSMYAFPVIFIMLFYLYKFDKFKFRYR